LAELLSRPSPHRLRFGAEAAFFCRSLALTLLLFGTGLLVHEGLHLVVLRTLGADGVIVVRPWRFSLLGWQIYGLHVQPLTQLSPAQQLLVNLAGPLLAAVPFAVLHGRVRDQEARLALALNIAILVFYAVLEGVYVVLESGLGLEGEWLTAAELNYGVPLLVTLFVLARAARTANSNRPQA
jgi:hypothetical protein